MLARLTLLVVIALSAALVVPTYAADDVLWVTTSTLLTTPDLPYADVIVLPGTPGRVVGYQSLAECPEDGPCVITGHVFRVIWRVGINSRGRYVQNIRSWISAEEVQFYRYKPPAP